MNILILTGNPINGAGGVERFCRDLIRICSRKGWRVQVLTPHDLAGRSVQLNAFTELLWAYRLGRVASRLVKKVDLVISNGIWGSWVDENFLRVNVYHGTWAGNYIKGQPRSPKKWVGRQLRTWAERQSGRNAINVAVSESVKGEVEQYYGLTVYRVIENGVDLDLFSPPSVEERLVNKKNLGLAPGRVLALYTGRMEWGKGIDRLNDLAKKIKTSTLKPPIEFCVVTPKIERKFYSRHIRYVIGDSVEKVLRAYRAADVFIFPSRYEGCEYVTLEALATGLLVIGTPTGAMQMLKERDPVLGRYIVDVCSVEALREKLEDYLVLSEEERTVVSRLARQYVEKWASLDLFERKWVTLIEEVSSRGKH
ncbi:MAG: glycosyltransferase family 4 protein [Nitrososphaerota archaeon]